MIQAEVGILHNARCDVCGTESRYMLSYEEVVVMLPREGWTVEPGFCACPSHAAEDEDVAVRRIAQLKWLQRRWPPERPQPAKETHALPS